MEGIEKVKHMNAFSVEFQKECKKANIFTTRLNPKNKVGLRTKRIFEYITEADLKSALANKQPYETSVLEFGKIPQRQK